MDARRPRADDGRMAKNKKRSTPRPRTSSPAAGLDIHGAEPVARPFTVREADGNADAELNISLPLTRKQHAQLERLMEEGYTEHDAYELIVGGEVLSHLAAPKKKRAATPRKR
jgi:hypothetical protein